MTSHPNRSKRNPKAGRNPTPDEIRKAREKAGLTQTQAAEIVFASLRAWQDYEGGQRKMHPSMWRDWNREVGS